MLLLLTTLSLCALVAMTFSPGRFWRPLLDEAEEDVSSWPEIDVIVPARNEAEALPACLPALLKQNYPGIYRVLLVDDHSRDGTGDLARRLAEESGKADRLTVIAAPELAAGWTGKVAAMQAGVAASRAPMILFTDADIRHEPYSLRQLVARAERGGFDLTSLMVKLNCETTAEKLLIPAFIFFFAMLYPFRLANKPNAKVAAAAGGVMLVRRAALDKSGGLAALKGALIDDCTLAKNIKASGGKISLTLTENATSLRRYANFRELHDVIARTAFTQLKHSNALLALTVIAMTLVFLVPIIAACSPDVKTGLVGNIAYLVMVLLYWPTLKFYKVSGWWAWSLPFAALFYMVATVNSARRTWAGQGGQWKGRTQNR